MKYLELVIWILVGLLLNMLLQDDAFMSGKIVFAILLCHKLLMPMNRSATVMMPEVLVNEARTRTFKTTTVGTTLVDHHRRLSAAAATAAETSSTTGTVTESASNKKSSMKHGSGGFDPHDPHAYLTGGVMGRQVFLEPALLSALGKLHYQITSNDGLVAPLPSK
jgi:hypothetical protein